MKPFTGITQEFWSKSFIEPLGTFTYYIIIFSTNFDPSPPFIIMHNHWRTAPANITSPSSQPLTPFLRYLLLNSAEKSLLKAAKAIPEVVFIFFSLHFHGLEAAMFSTLTHFSGLIRTSWIYPTKSIYYFVIINTFS